MSWHQGPPGEAEARRGNVRGSGEQRRDAVASRRAVTSPARLHRCLSLVPLALVALAGCVETSSREPDVPDWKRPRAGALDVSDASLGEAPSRSPLAAIRYADPFWSSCYRSFAPTEDAVSDLDRLGFACGSPRGLAAVAPVHVGSQKAEDAAERLVFRARKGRCYRVFAIGGAEVRDLDVSILAPDGRLVAADLSKDAWSVVPPRAPWCPEDEGPYAIDVSVADGEGSYALGVWGSELD